MLGVPCNTRTQRDSQHGKVTPQRVGSIGYLGKGRVKAIQLHVGYLCLSHSPQNPLTHPRVKHLDDGVPDTISLLVSFSCDHTPKTFQCASMYIHLF
jgi:hypothetical protein